MYENLPPGNCQLLKKTGWENEPRGENKLVFKAFDYYDFLFNPEFFFGSLVVLPDLPTVKPCIFIPPEFPQKYLLLK